MTDDFGAVDGSQERGFRSWLRSQGVNPDNWFREATDEEFMKMMEEVKG
jgi:hypothetical protein